MGALDFLFEGKPPQSVTTYGQTVENMPRWLSDYTQGLIAKGNAIAAEPYQPYGGPRIAGFSPDQQTAFDMTRQNVGSYNPSMQQAMGYTQQAGGASPTGAASPYMQKAMQVLPGGTGSPLQAAAPYMSGAAQTFPGQVQNYMDPYVENVINRGSQLAKRTFDERINPSISDQFIRGGQYGSSAHMREANRAARDLTEGLNAQNMAALSQGYTTAGQLFGQDASRLGNLAQIAGSLQGQGQQLRLGESQQLGNLGQIAGTLSGQEGQLKLGAGEQMGNLASALQQMGIRDAAQLDAIGAQQQQMGQRNMDLAYSDFQQQRDYPKSQVEWMSQLIRGMPFDKTTTTSQTGPANVYQPSPLAQLASLGSAFGAWQQATGGGG